MPTARITGGMTAELKYEHSGSSLVKVQVYMHSTQRQALREIAARRGMSMSEYIKMLIDRASRGWNLG